MRLVARHPPRSSRETERGMRATPWPRAANRGRFSLTQSSAIHDRRLLAYVNADGAIFSVRPRGKGGPDLERSVCVAPGPRFSRGRTGGGVSHAHKVRATFWQIETTRACDINGGCRGMGLAMTLAARRDQYCEGAGKRMCEKRAMNKMSHPTDRLVKAWALAC